MSTKNEILPLTGLRFIAALYVFLFHIEINWHFAPSGAIGNIVSQGAVGMSVFFVLSGFLLAYQYSGRFEDRKTYFVRRIARIYPIYIVAALSTIPWIYGGKIDAPKLPVLDTVFLVITDIFALQAWVPSYFTYWNNGGSWSISVEVFCYAILPFVAPWMARLSNMKLLGLAGLLYAWTVIPGQLPRVFPELSFAFLYALPAFRLPEFLLGVCGFLAMQRGFRFSHPNMATASIVLAFVVLINVRLFGLQYIGYNWFVIPVVVLAVMSLCQSNGIIFTLLSSRLFVWLGKISYCFYSFQALVLLTLIRFHEELISWFPIMESNFALCVFAFFVLILLSAIGHHLIEEPFRRKIQRWYDFRRDKRLEVEKAYTA